MKVEDPYAVLGISMDATPEEIKAAWRAGIVRTHPDKGGRAEDMIEVQAAYEMLKDPLRRATYDRERSNRNRSNESSSRSGPRNDSPPKSDTTVDDLIRLVEDLTKLLNDLADTWEKMNRPHKGGRWEDIPPGEWASRIDPQQGYFCAGINREGFPCMASRLEGSPFCGVHDAAFRRGDRPMHVKQIALCKSLTKKGAKCMGIAVDGGYCYSHHPSRWQPKRTGGASRGGTGTASRKGAGPSDRTSANSRPVIYRTPPRTAPVAAPSHGVKRGRLVLLLVAVVAICVVFWNTRGDDGPRYITFSKRIKDAEVTCQSVAMLTREESTNPFMVECFVRDWDVGDGDEPYVELWGNGCERTRLNGTDDGEILHTVRLRTQVAACGKPLTQLDWRICQTRGGPLPDDCTAGHEDLD